MVDGDRARMELMYSLCFSLPGTPVLFYGEEIGMGDDQSLEQRNAVRTAMQWTADPNAGFSTAPRPAIARPPIKDGPFGYRRVNVEKQRQKPGSFLSWMERLIRTRREWPEFGWGEARVLPTGDDAVLAHTAEWESGQILAIHNLSGRSVKASIKLPREKERGRWHHLVGPSRGRAAMPEGDVFAVDLGPYEYHWFGHREGP
jgi:maltose alpha-D-glucosyltransferase / alpha-amylase